MKIIRSWWCRFARSCWWVVLLALTLSAPVRANHLVGADWQLVPVVGNQFRVRLTMYTDPVSGGSNTAGDQSVTVAAYEHHAGPGGYDPLVASYTLPRTGNRALPGPAPGCGRVSVPIREITYEATLTLDPVIYHHPLGYYLAWERCCRNQFITNVANGQNAPLSATLEFPALTLPLLGGQRNASPQFGVPPPAVALCVGEAAQVSFGATDADGDSLAYALVAPLGGFTSPADPLITVPNPGPYPALSLVAGFSASQPLAGSVALDPRTGLLTGTLTQPGTYLLAVVVREYRRGVLIGENRRETELSVATCLANGAPALTRVLPAPPDTVVVTRGADRCFTVRAFDPDAGQTLSISALEGGLATITPARFTVQFPAAPVAVSVCLTDCAQPGPRVLTLVVRDDGCTASRPDTLRVPLRFAPAPNARPTLTRAPATPDTLVVTTGEPLLFTVTARDPDADPLNLRLRSADAPGLAPAAVLGAGPLELVVRWTPPCGAARAQPYELWVRATDGACTNAADSLRVLVRARDSPLATYLPNIITPNGDGENDCFELARASAAPGACADSFREVRIFNRWGRLVYQSADPAFCWTAPNAAAGTYFYVVRGAQRSFRGWLAVVR